MNIWKNDIVVKMTTDLFGIFLEIVYFCKLNLEIIMIQNIIDLLYLLAMERGTFLFVVNYAGTDAYIKKLSEIDSCECLL